MDVTGARADNVLIASAGDIAEPADLGHGTKVWNLAQVREYASLGEKRTVGRGPYIGSGVKVGANPKITICPPEYVTGEKGTLVAETMSADPTLFENGTIETELAVLGAFLGVTEGHALPPTVPKPERHCTEHKAFSYTFLAKSSGIVTLEASLESLGVAETVLNSADGRLADRVQSTRQLELAYGRCSASPDLDHSIHQG